MMKKYLNGKIMIKTIIKNNTFYNFLTLYVLNLFTD